MPRAVNHDVVGHLWTLLSPFHEYFSSQTLGEFLAQVLTGRRCIRGPRNFAALAEPSLVARFPSTTPSNVIADLVTGVRAIFMIALHSNRLQ